MGEGGRQGGRKGGRQGETPTIASRALQYEQYKLCDILALLVANIYLLDSSYTEDMPDDSDRELLNKLGISFKRLGSHALPLQHCRTFNRIRAIQKKNLDDYHKDSTSQSNKPWREQTYKRAKWLATCAAKLVDQQRNEAGWRFNIENDVFHRFRVDVAWLVLHNLQAYLDEL